MLKIPRRAEMPGSACDRSDGDKMDDHTLQGLKLLLDVEGHDRGGRRTITVG